jgi:hypothetical protein
LLHSPLSASFPPTQELSSYLAPLVAIGITLIATLTPSSSEILKWIPLFLWGFGQNHILNTSTVALMASVDHSQMPVVTGVMWLFRSTVRHFPFLFPDLHPSVPSSPPAARSSSYTCELTAPYLQGQVVGVASSGAILQNFLSRELKKRITGKGAAKAIRDIRINSSIIAALPQHLQDAARQSYATALRHVFVFCAIGATLAWLFVCCVSLSISPFPMPCLHLPLFSQVPDINLERRAGSSPSPPAGGARSAETDPLLVDEAEETIAERRVEADAEERV